MFDQQPQKEEKEYREILPGLDDAAFKTCYNDFTKNPLFGALITFLDGQIGVMDTTIDNPPDRADGPGFFALREQAIGGRFALNHLVKAFLLEDIKPITTQEDESE